MTPNDVQSQLIKYLTDAHSIERPRALDASLEAQEAGSR